MFMVFSPFKNGQDLFGIIMVFLKRVRNEIVREDRYSLGIIEDGPTNHMTDLYHYTEGSIFTAVEPEPAFG